ncbi:hypothetical protein [Ideonella sp.]|uniref:hypothetical protein n=1 Tax=Ideonella sp. TaxID=1929293 RepID=UPI003BB7E26F
MTTQTLIRGALLGTALAVIGQAALALDVGVSIGFSQPGVYGRVDIGHHPQPALVVQQPVLIRPVRGPVIQPVYLWVPPGHRRNWRKHCGRYNACGAPVYFVEDQWYHQNVVRPYGRERHEDHGRSYGPEMGRGPDHGRGHGRD